MKDLLDLAVESVLDEGPETTPGTPDTKGAEPDDLFDQAVEDVLGDTERTVGASLALVQDDTPEKAAKRAQLAERFGVRPEALKGREEWFEAEARAAQLRAGIRSPRSLVRVAPRTADLVADPNAAAFVKDDLERLAGFEQAMDRYRRKWRRGQAVNVLGELSYRRMAGGELSRDEQRRLAEARATLAQEVSADGFLESSALEATEVLGQMAAGWPTIAKRSMQGGMVGAAIGSTALPGLGTVGGFVAGLGAGAGAGIGEQSARVEGGAAYDELVQQGIDPRLAAGLATGVGAVNGVLETVGELGFTKPVVTGIKRLVTREAVKRLARLTAGKAAARAVGTYAKAWTSEVATEVAQELTNIAAQAAAAEIEGRPELMPTQDQVVERLAGIAEKTGKAMLLLALPGATTHYAADLRQVARARDAREAFDALHQATEESTAARVDKDAWARVLQWLASDDGLDDVYVNAEKLGEVLQQSGYTPDVLDQVSPQFAEEFREAREVGGDVRIPLDAYTRHVAGTELHEQIAPHLKVVPGGLSLSEAPQLLDEMAEALERDYMEAFAEQEGVRDSVEDRIVADLAPKVARDPQFQGGAATDQARLVARFFRVMGERSGMDPWELYQRWNLEVRKELPEAVKEQLRRDTFDAAIDRARKLAAGEEPGPLVQPGPSLVEFLRQRGGISDPGGELRAMDAVKQRPGLVALAGEDPDTAMEAAWEAGYFPEFDERPTPDVLIEAVREELAGAKRYTLQDIERMQADRADLELLLQTLGELGVDITTASNEEVRAALEGVEAEAGVEADTLAQSVTAVDVAPKFLGLSYQDAERRLAKDVIGQIAGKVVNRKTGWEIEATKRGLRHAALRRLKSTRLDVARLEAIAAWKDLLEHARVVESRPSSKGGPEIKNIHRLVSLMRLGGSVYTVQFTVKEYKPGAFRADDVVVRRLYDVGLKGKAPAGSSTGLNQGPTPSSTAGAKLNLSGETQDVNKRKSAGSGSGDVLEQAGPLEEQPRATIAFLDDQTLITLGQKADFSSFLHESGHLFLRAFRELAAMESAPEALRADWDAVKEWLGAEGDELTKEQEEQFARGFEAYLFEGKAPTEEVRGIFTKFRAWLLAIYRHLKTLNVELTDEIRGVFDRMLATEDEIQETERREGLAPDPKAEELMTEAERKAYHELLERARADAVARWEAAKLRALAQERRKVYREAKRQVQAEMEHLVRNRRVYQAIHWMSRGEWMGDPETKPAGLDRHFWLDRDMVVAEYGPEVLPLLRKAVPPIVRKGGVHPDVAAQLLGYENGRALLDDIIAASPRSEAVRQTVAAEMQQRFPDPAKDTAQRAEELLKAVRGDARGRAMAFELEAIHRRIRSPGERNQAAADVLKAAAGRIIAKKTVREATRLGAYRRAELKALRARDKALADGRLEEAFEHGRRALLNYYLMQEAIRVRDKVRRAGKVFAKAGTKKRLAGVDPQAVRQVVRLLDRLGLPSRFVPEQADPVEGEALQPLTLAEFVQAMDDDGIDVVLSPWVADETNRVRETAENELSVQEYLGAADSVRSILRAGKGRRKLFVAAGGGNIDHVASWIAGEIDTRAKRRQPPKGTTSWGPRDALRAKISAAVSGLRKVEFLFRELDGFEGAGPVHQTLYQPLADALDWELTTRADYAGRLHALARKHGLTNRFALQKKVTVEGWPVPLTREKALAMALNWGNEGNRLALARGIAGELGVSLEAAYARIEKTIETLTDGDWAFVQGTWDLINQLWPEIAAMQREISGVAPPKVEAIPVEIGGRIVARGGYYPLKYDSRFSERAKKHEDLANSNRLFENHYARAMTAHGHTQERVGSAGQPVRLDLGVVAQHIDQVIHDLAFRRAIIDVDRLTQHELVREAIISVAGREAYRLIRPWLQAVANERFDTPPTWWDRQVLKLRRSVTLGVLGLRLTTAVRQWWSYGGVAKDLGAVPALNGLARFLDWGNPRAIARTVQEVLENSKHVPHRFAAFDRDMREAFQLSSLTGYQKQVGRFAFFLLGLVDMAAVIPAWLAAYDHAVAQGWSHERAVNFADQTVRTTQPTSHALDLSAVQRSRGMKPFTMFYSYFAVLANQYIDQVNRTRGRVAAEGVAKGLAKSLPEWAATVVWLLVMPALVSELAVGRGPDDDDEWAAWAAKNLVKFPLQTLPIVRDVAGAAVDYAAGDWGEYELSPMANAGEAAVRAIGGVGRAIVEDEPLTEGTVRNLFRITGYLTGVPSEQIWVTGTAFIDYLEGQDVEPSEFVFRRKR